MPEKQEIFKRNLFDELKSHLAKNEFTILTWARQTGKSTLMRQLQDDCKKDGIPEVYITVENKSIFADLDENPLNLLAYLPRTEKRVMVFIHEIQYLTDPSNFMKPL